MTTRTFTTATMKPGLTDLKAHLRITGSDFDNELLPKLLAAIRSAEHFIGGYIALSSFKYTGAFASTIDLEDSPEDLTSVKVDGASVSSDHYTYQNGTITFDDTVEGDAVEVTYNCGSTDVEPDIQAAILLHAGYIFNNPLDTVETLQKASTNLLRPYRRWGNR